MIPGKAMPHAGKMSASIQGSEAICLIIQARGEYNGAIAVITLKFVT
jgi:hypothetical protein